MIRQTGHHVAVYDYIRFFAAIFVAYYHLAYWSWADNGGTTFRVARGAYQYPELAGSASLGWVGVEIFFVLSGIVIAMTSNGASAAKFARSRFLRLWPALLVCAIIMFVVAVVFGAYDPQGALLRLVKTWVLWPTGPWIDGVYWSLVVEVVFYAIVLLLILLDLNRRIAWLGLALALYSLVLNVWNFAGDAGIGDNFFFRFALGQYGCFFALGIAIFLIGRTGRMSALLSATMGLALGGSVLELLYHAAAHEVTGMGAPAVVVIWATAVGLMLLGSVRFGLIAQLPIVRTVGLLTYPLYLIHDIVGAALLRVMADVGLPRWWALAFALSAVVVLALTVTTTVERSLARKMSSAFERLEGRLARATMLRRLFVQSQPLEQPTH